MVAYALADKNAHSASLLQTNFSNFSIVFQIFVQIAFEDPTPNMPTDSGNAIVLDRKY